MAYKKGESGNPAGRKPGARTKNTIMLNALKKYGSARNIDVAQKIIENVAAKALDGDGPSERLILDKLLPNIKPISNPVDLGRLPKDLFAKGEKIMLMATSATIPIETARELISSIGTLLKAKEQLELEDRLKEIEKLLV